MEGNYVRRDEKHGEENVRLEEQYSWGSSWPARNYSCSFCKREFRSAQALGGHMNVHRRDRARLRSGIIPPFWLHNSDSSLKPNPITSTPPSNNPSSLSDHAPSLTLSYSASDDNNKKPPMLVTSSSSKPPLLSPESRELMIMNGGNTRSIRSVNEELKKGCPKEQGLKGFGDVKEDNITLELGLGLLQRPKEQIDLELRLGHF